MFIFHSWPGTVNFFSARGCKKKTLCLKLAFKRLSNSLNRFATKAKNTARGEDFSKNYFLVVVP